MTLPGHLVLQLAFSQTGDTDSSRAPGLTTGFQSNRRHRLIPGTWSDKWLSVKQERVTHPGHLVSQLAFSQKGETDSTGSWSYNWLSVKQETLTHPGTWSHNWLSVKQETLTRPGHLVLQLAFSQTGDTDSSRAPRLQLAFSQSRDTDSSRGPDLTTDFESNRRY